MIDKHAPEVPVRFYQTELAMNLSSTGCGASTGEIVA
jgi:hypothetical protein